MPASIWKLFPLLGFLAVLSLPDRANAQGVGPGFVGGGGGGRGRPSRPAVSPYTALGSRNPVVGYFTITRPSLEQRALIDKQQAEIDQLERRAGLSRTPGGTLRESGFEFNLPRTGHRIYFSNYSHFYK